MKVFEDKKKYQEKVNFVDENNVFVGYNMDQNCCEFFGWFIQDTIAKTLPDKKNKDKESLSEYRFDPTYIKEIKYLGTTPRDKNSNQLDEGGMVVFRLVSVDGKKEKFLHLYNCHNGYYGHGFEFKIGDKLVKDGCL